MGEEGLEEASVPSRLKRAITLRYAVAMYISSVLGAGILVIPGLAARIAGPGSLLSWLLLSLASYPFAYTFASLSSRRPESGGIYAFARESFGRRAATVVVWLFVAWIIFGAPAITLAAADYLAASLPVTQPETFVIAAGIMLFAFAINFGGIKLSGRVQLATVVAVILVLLGVVTFSAGNIKPSNFAPFLPSGIGSVGVASALIVWSFLGYENVSNVAEEFQDPKRDFGRSVVISVLVIGALYFVVALATIGTGAYAEGTGVAPFAVMASAVFGVYGGLTVSLLALFVIFGTFNAYTAGLARMFYAAARDGELPAMLGKVDTASGVPRRALLFLLAVDLSSLLAYYVLHLDIQMGFLGTSGAAVLTYLIGSAAGIRLLRGGGLRRLLPWLSFAAAVALLFFVGSLLILSLAIVVLALFYSSLRSKGRPEPIEG